MIRLHVNTKEDGPGITKMAMKKKKCKSAITSANST